MAFWIAVNLICGVVNLWMYFYMEGATTFNFIAGMISLAIGIIIGGDYLGSGDDKMKDL